MIPTKNILLLASKSRSRKYLLTKAGIPFQVIEQDADEQIKVEQLADTVFAIAQQKMAHVILPADLDIARPVYVLTADTLVQNQKGEIYGKPIDVEDAVRMIKDARDGMQVSTAFCLDKKVWNGTQWHTVEQITDVVHATCVVDVPDDIIPLYIKSAHTMNCAGAIAIEDLGSPFLKSITGSYSAIIGLPLFEVHQALTKSGFFE